jgi:DNA polymerase III psi subunit
MAAAAKPALRPEVVTKAELLELARAEQEHTSAQSAASLAESTVKALRLSLVEKVLGLTAEQLKHLSQDEVHRLYLLRLKKGLWTPAKNAPLFVFEESSHGRYPAWKSLYAAIVGEGKAARVQAETSATYSYRVRIEE